MQIWFWHIINTDPMILPQLTVKKHDLTGEDMVSGGLAVPIKQYLQNITISGHCVSPTDLFDIAET